MSSQVACGDWLLELADEPVRAPAPAAPASGRGDRTVVYVAGLVSDCLDQAERAREEFQAYLAELGYRFEILPVSGLSSSGVNATFIRDEMQRRPEFADAEQLIVVGHSKGVIDVLEALVTYPELRTRINAVVSLAGAIGGSPLADIAPDLAMTVVRHTPGLDCRDGDGGALQSLRPRVRRDWLARHPLPAEVDYYSIVALPTSDRVSAGLKPAHLMLRRFDARNDGNLLFYDQVIPGSTLLGYANADHWAIATDLAASPNIMARAFATRSDFPRRVLMEAVLRFIDSDSSVGPNSSGTP